MRINTLLALSIGACFLEASPAIFAAAPSNSVKLEQAVDKLTAESAELQAEVKELKAELNQQKQQKARFTPAAPSSNQANGEANLPPQINANGSQSVRTAAIHHTSKTENIPQVFEYKDLVEHGVALNVGGEPILTPEEEISQEREQDIEYLVGSYVMTSMVLNIHSMYDASDLLVNQSTMNEDLRFLQQRQTLEQIVGYKALPSATRPRIFLSGRVEPLFSSVDPYTGSSGNTSTFTLGGAELDALAEASPWAFGFLSMVFDNSSYSSILPGSGNPVNNSNIILNRGFVTIGNLDKSPVYFSAGQEYVPFGRYVAFQLSNPVTKIEGRINTRAAVLGYYNSGLYLSAYGMNGATNVNNNNDLDEWGANAGYKHSTDSGFSYQLGAGFVNDIAEAQGYQSTGASDGAFQGFSNDSATEALQHRVPGFDAHLSLGKGPFSIYSEYVMATESFAWQDLTFDNSGAHPRAAHVEGDYAFKVLRRPTSLTLAYEHTWESFPLNLPQNSVIGALNTSLWKNTIETFEYRHDLNYSTSNSGGGICDPNNSGTATFCNIQSPGGTQNIILAQIGVYF